MIIVIDAAKGVEAQTRKLMNVCRMRKTPVMVFVNKLDRPALDPFELLDEIEQELEIHVHPLAGRWVWDPISGVYTTGLNRFFVLSAAIPNKPLAKWWRSDLKDRRFRKHIAPSCGKTGGGTGTY